VSKAWAKGTTAAWRRARTRQLASVPFCEDCGRRADQVDHVLGAGNDPGHQILASVCRPCHQKRTTTRLRQAGGKIRDPGHRVVVVSATGRRRRMRPA
jgi:5-methylcytosine-specific restriction endonuclease McrA